MELIGSLFLIAALALVVALFILRPFLGRSPGAREGENAEMSLDHQRSALMAKRDQALTALQELDFDNALGKVPAEEYQEQRSSLLKDGANALRKLDELGASRIADGHSAGEAADASSTVEERIEAAVAARRADLSRAPVRAGVSLSEAAGESLPGNGNGKQRDAMEDMIAARKRQRKESAAGFCPRCGRPVQKSDKFCSRCGADL
jgi:hypothetical protein